MFGSASAFHIQFVERALVSRRLLLAVGTAALAIASIAASAAFAHAHSYRPYYRACVTADHGAWLYAPHCHRYRCWVPVHSGRAFRVVRQTGGYLLVRNLEMRGWVELNSLHIAPQEYCRAAGI
jgi:hypothetical protein